MKADRLNVLLARGRLIGPVREQILDGALRDAGFIPARSRLWRAAGRWGLPLLAAAAAAVFMLRPTRDGFRAKGGAARPQVSVECSQGTLEHCSRSGTLLFRVEGLEHSLHLYAYAEPRAGGERVWLFFPDGSEPVLAASAEPQLLRQGVKLRSLFSGHYRVHLVTNGQAASQDQVLSGRLAEQTLELGVEP